MISASGTESKPKTRAYIKRQWCFGPGGMQNNVYDFGGPPKLLAIGGYGGPKEKVRKRVRLLVFSYSMYTGEFKYSY